MPMVPTQFAPSVSVQPTQTPRLVAPTVVPGQNDTPQLIQKLGQDAQQNGAQMRQIGQTIGDRIQIMQDDALTKNAETQFLTSATKTVSDYTHTLGQDALNGYDDAQQAVVQAKADAEGTLTNDIQKRAFNYVAQEHLNNIGKVLSDHHFQQNVAFSSDAAKDRSDSLIQQAANNYSDWQRPDGEYAMYRAHAVNEALQGANLRGLPPDINCQRAN